MITQDVLFGGSARKKMLAGIEKVSSAVASTLGARGRFVIIDRQRNPHITKDGVTVARSIELTDRVEAIGARVVLDAANKTVFGVGDGTTTATILTSEIIKLGFSLPESTNMIAVKSGLEKGAAAAKNYIDHFLTREITSAEQLRHIATVSANNDEEVGGVVADAVELVGRQGGINVEISRDNKTYVEKSEGMEIDFGFASPYFINNTAKAECTLSTGKQDGVAVLIYDGVLSSLKDCDKIFNAVAVSGKNLLVFAEKCEGEVLGTLLANHERGNLHSCVVNIPGYAINTGFLEDIAKLTGARVFSFEKGTSLRSINKEVEAGKLHPGIGTCKRVVVKKNSTTIVGGNGNPEEISAYAAELLEQAEGMSDGPPKEFVKERGNKLSYGVAVIKVGGFTEVEIKEKKDRIDDAINATMQANRHGFVAGGATTYLHCLGILQTMEVSKDEAVGVDLLVSAMQAPFRTLLQNADLYRDKRWWEFWKPASKFHIDVIAIRKYGIGVDVKHGVVIDLFQAGIIDPAAVVKTALENAVSAAATLLTTSCVVYDVPDETLGL